MELVAGAMDSLLPKLGELLKEEYKVHKGVREHVESLSRELELMHAALRKVAKVPQEQLDEPVKLWARDARELSYDMEDVIDTFLVRVGDGRDATPNPHRLKWLLKKMGNLFRKGKARRQIADAIKDINNQLQELAKRRGRYSVHDIVAMPAATSAIDRRLMAMYKDAAQLIGIDGPRDALIQMLSNRDDASNKKMKIVSIFGFGGLGKTTLAKAVYDNLKAGFVCCAFVSIGQNPDMKKVLRDILIDIYKEISKKLPEMQQHTKLDPMTLDERQLINQLRELLENNRYLVVIDDIWAISVWTFMRCALPDNNLKNRIITTTRILDVAEQLGGAYKLQPLTDANSEKLFYGRVFGGECPDNQLREVSNKILRKCGGVPLAIVTIASLLNSEMKNTRECNMVDKWNKVHDSIGSGLLNGTDMKDMRVILSLSYYSLPPHLRACLLYVSIFPEDYKIMKDQLIWLWIAEGFIQYGEQGDTLYELGEYYFNELINRSLIQSGDMLLDGRVEYCRVHDMVLDLIRSLSKEESFVTVLDGAEQNTSLQRNDRRLSIQNTSKVEHTASLDAMRMPQALRSLTVFSSPAINLKLPLMRFRSLRVLELGGCDVGEACHLNLGNLLHLRYLGLRKTGIKQLPGDIGKLQFLQTLDLGENGIPELPSTLVQLTQLMCLLVDPRTRLPDGMGSLASLEVLSGMYVKDFDFEEVFARDGKSPDFVDELCKLTGLRELKIELFIGPDGVSFQEDLAYSLSNLPKIQTLDIHAREGCCLDRFGKCWVPPERLVCFSFVGLGFFSWMPTCIEKNLKRLSDLSSLSIHVKQLWQEEDMQILARLPALRFLWIRGGSGGRLIIGADGFHCLREFTFWNDTPGRVMFQQGAMPRVERVSFPLCACKAKDDGNDGFETGIKNLLSLEFVEVRLNCGGASAGEVKEAVAALRHAADVNPNSPTLRIQRQ